MIPVRGGASELSAHYQYNGGTGGVSAPLSTTVAGVTTHLSVTADAAPVAGYPFSVRVALTSAPPECSRACCPCSCTPTACPSVSTQYAHSTGSEPPSATFYGVVPKRGFVSFTASTPGDGADLGPGDGGTTVLLAGAPLHLSARDGLRYEATFGKDLTITPEFSWGATTGAGPTDGRLTVAVVGADGSSRTCEAQLPCADVHLPGVRRARPGHLRRARQLLRRVVLRGHAGRGPGDGSGGTDVGELVVTGTRSTLCDDLRPQPAHLGGRARR